MYDISLGKHHYFEVYAGKVNGPAPGTCSQLVMTALFSVDHGGSQTQWLIRDSVAFQPLHLITDLLCMLGMAKVTDLPFQYPLISQTKEL